MRNTGWSRGEEYKLAARANITSTPALTMTHEHGGQDGQRLSPSSDLVRASAKKLHSPRAPAILRDRRRRGEASMRREAPVVVSFRSTQIFSQPPHSKYLRDRSSYLLTSPCSRSLRSKTPSFEQMPGQKLKTLRRSFHRAEFLVAQSFEGHRPTFGEIARQRRATRCVRGGAAGISHAASLGRHRTAGSLAAGSRDTHKQGQGSQSYDHGYDAPRRHPPPGEGCSTTSPPAGTRRPAGRSHSPGPHRRP